MSGLLMSASGAADHGGKRLAATAFVSAFLSTAVGLAIGSAWLLPVLNVLGVYPVYLRLILKGRLRQAVAVALLWALFLSQAVIIATCLFPQRSQRVTLIGAEYRNEMFEWVRTGQGEESSPRLFIPVHVRDFAIFAAVSFATGGLGGLFMGAVLLNYMNFYVGSLVVAARHPVLTALFGWQPYAIIRVISYILVATALAAAFWALLGRRRMPRGLGRYGACGVTGVMLDVLLKWLIAPAWSALLRWTTGLV